MGRLYIVNIQAVVGCSAGKLNSSHSVNIPSVRQKPEKKHLQLSPLLKISHLLGGFGILFLNRPLAANTVNPGHSGFCRAWDPSVVTHRVFERCCQQKITNPGLLSPVTIQCPLFSCFWTVAFWCNVWEGHDLNTLLLRAAGIPGMIAP